MEGHNESNNHQGSGGQEDSSPNKGSLTPGDKPFVFTHEEGRIMRKAVKGHIESSDIKRSLNLHDDPQINHVTLN